MKNEKVEIDINKLNTILFQGKKIQYEKKDWEQLLDAFIYLGYFWSSSERLSRAGDLKPYGWRDGTVRYIGHGGKESTLERCGRCQLTNAPILFNDLLIDAKEKLEAEE